MNQPQPFRNRAELRSERCPKCLGTDWTMAWELPARFAYNEAGAPPDVLRVKCLDCGWWFEMEPADANGPESWTA